MKKANKNIITTTGLEIKTAFFLKTVKVSIEGTKFELNSYFSSTGGVWLNVDVKNPHLKLYPIL
jgi:hypothetical protein